jgi:hypothetical protein
LHHTTKQFSLDSVFTDDMEHKKEPGGFGGGGQGHVAELEKPNDSLALVVSPRCRASRSA